MLINLKDITAIAEQHTMAIGSFNCPSLESIRASIDTAEKLGYPVIIAHAQGHEDIVPLSVIGPIMVALAERSSAPVCVHLDHCEDLCYMRRALDLGFTGVMFDGSMLEYERNVELAKRAADMCGQFDCGLECELGSMGPRENGRGHEKENVDTPDAIYTDPKQAVEFIGSTGCDLLAVSFGTVHGIYKGTPHLSFKVLEELRCHTMTPLVMHGGSGVSDSDYHQAIQAGIRKINYYTYGAKFAGERVKKVISDFQGLDQSAIVYWHDMTEAVYDELCIAFEHVMNVFANKLS
ncbi:Tagatose-bisphosphate aldolase [Coriobacterium glomerans PW2]|uniref:Tagatose-bisphosphate aldolase n=1 Tax=Coriobacterium glomerans (strain ATCC 49209 / DSM 20642 / JCM 10262 / PW2) TaxID=700015 RepID=F2N7V0_CORGP|nr:class II fructose-bisphosphate aldolase [Coriobacterium glomerans]AEB07059.1 Tagatose-bisphosphate aldolase [Coriobacterium glomerans PW2]